MAIQDNLEFKIVSSTINWDEQGIANASLVATIGKDLAVAKALSMQAHPDYPYMLRSGGRVTKMWRLSGRRGWDDLIYGTASSAT